MNKILSALVLLVSVLFMGFVGWFSFFDKTQDNVSVNPVVGEIESLEEVENNLGDLGAEAENNQQVASNPAEGSQGSGEVVQAQDPNWTPCDGLFPYTGNQGNSTFVDTTAGALYHVNGNPVVVGNGYEVRGCVRQIAGTYDNWGPFEGYLGAYRIKDSSGNVLISGPLTALLTTQQTEIMDAAIAGENLAFKETVNYDFSNLAGQSGTLELVNGNASGEAANDRSVSYSIVFN